ncbi:MAG: tRNA 2-thiocytidine biosynthesis protein TtcA [Clostridia bacterium]|nr:tRNA 2-thiocytidine biosynthesis protein TtcA [Clostridia bacterium]
MSIGEIERSIIKKFRKEVWCRFVSAVKEYDLISEGDKIAVCISGGKDSFLLAKCMQEIARHGKYHFDLEFIVMDPGYAEGNRALIFENAEKLGVPVKVFESDIFSVVTSVSEGSPCYLCARMRRGYLYEYAKSLGCNKIALGHHFNDVVETALLSMFYGAEVKTMMPKLHSTSHKGMQLIRPLYMVREEDIVAWAKYNGLTFLNCACRFTEKVASKEEESKRREIKRLISSLKEGHPDIDKNIFRSMHNVNLDSTLGWRKGREWKSFLTEYDREE